MEKIKVAVLFGGQSTEHAVSLQSACAVLHAMKGTRFEAVPVGITREGRWFWYRGPLDAVGEGVWEKEECAPVTLTPDASVHGLLVQGAGSLYLDAAFPGLMAQRGVTLEEYIGALGAYTPEQPLHAEAGGRGFDIFRVPLGPEGARFDAPRDRVWQASADNCGGLVVTVWGAV